MITHHNKIKTMVEEGFLENLPDYIKTFIMDELDINTDDVSGREYVSGAWIWYDWEEVLDEGNDKQPIDGSAFLGPDCSYKFIPSLWSWFLFWKNIMNSFKIIQNSLGPIFISHFCCSNSIWFIFMST